MGATPAPSTIAGWWSSTIARSADPAEPCEHPAPARLEADVRVVVDRRWRREEQDGGGAAGLLGAVDQLLADPLLLVIDVNRQIREVRAKGEITEAARDADQARLVPGGDDQ